MDKTFALFSTIYTGAIIEVHETAPRTAIGSSRVGVKVRLSFGNY